MRNLKKVLSLALALTMLIGMMVIGASAAVTNINDFTDVGEISDEYREAVDLLSAIEVLQGDEGGFRPTGTLTREEAAKIVTYLSLGVDAAEALTTITDPFVDVAADRWSAKYVAYCANMGIINGVGDGRFDPTSQVTGFQFAKMLLCVLGYGAKDEYVGANWVLNASRDANTTGVAARTAISNVAITRQEAAQLAFNTLILPLVTYSELVGTYSSNIFSTSGAGQTLLGTIAYNIFKIYCVNDNDVLGYGYRYWRYAGNVSPLTDSYPGSFTLVLEGAGTSPIGFSAARQGYKMVNETILGTVTGGTVGEMFRSYVWNDAFTGLYENGKDMSAGLELGVRADGQTTDVNNNDVITTLSTGDKGLTPVTMRGSTKPAISYNGQYIDVIDTNGDGAADKLVVVTAYMGEVTRVTAATSSSDRTVTARVYVPNGAGNISKTFETEDYAQGDRIMVTPADTLLKDLTGNLTVEALSARFGQVVAHEKCGEITGNVNAFYRIINASNTKVSQFGSVGVGDSRYNYNGIFHTAKDGPTNNGTKVAVGQALAENGYTLTEATYKFYLDALNNVVAAEVVSDVVGNFAYIVDVGHDQFSKMTVVRAVLSNGDSGVYNISANSGKDYDDAVLTSNTTDLKGVSSQDIYNKGSFADISKGRIYWYTKSGDTLTLQALPTVGETKDGSNNRLPGRYANPAVADSMKDGSVMSDNRMIIRSFTKGLPSLVYTKVDGSEPSAVYTTEETVFVYMNSNGTVASTYTGRSNAPTVSGATVGSAVSVATETINGVRYATMVVIKGTPIQTATDHLYITNATAIGNSQYTTAAGKTVYYYEALVNNKPTVVATYSATLTGIGVYGFNLKNDQFESDPRWNVEAGVYDITGRITNVVEGPVLAKSNADAIIVARGNAASGDNVDILLGAAPLYDTANKLEPLRVNQGDTVTIVYDTTTHVAQHVYVTTPTRMLTQLEMAAYLTAGTIPAGTYTYETPNNGTGSVTLPNLAPGATVYVLGNAVLPATNGGVIVANTVTLNAAKEINGVVTVTENWFGSADVSRDVTVAAGATLNIHGDAYQFTATLNKGSVVNVAGALSNGSAKAPIALNSATAKFTAGSMNATTPNKFTAKDGATVKIGNVEYTGTISTSMANLYDTDASVSAQEFEYAVNSADTKVFTVKPGTQVSGATKKVLGISLSGWGMPGTTADPTVIEASVLKIYAPSNVTANSTVKVTKRNGNIATDADLAYTGLWGTSTPADTDLCDGTDTGGNYFVLILGTETFNADANITIDWGNGMTQTFTVNTPYTGS